jgi:hypothetical protein
MLKNKLTFLALALSFAVFSQEDRNEIIQQRIEFISEQAETEEIDLTNIFEQLNYYYDHPVNLNNGDAEALRSLGLLTDVQITDLLLHLRQFGRLISIYELQSLAYWDMPTIQLVRPFVRVDERLDQLHITFHDAIEEGKLELYARYQRTPEKKAGYANVSDSVRESSSSYYYGNADRYYSRLRYTYRSNISIGVTAEKDPGEQFFRGSQYKGFDFYSGHAFFKGGKYLRSAAVGDYLVQIGQGLNAWSGYAFGKTADVFASKKTATMLRPYTSVDESRYYRGAAAVAGIGRFSLLAFYSQKKIDGAGISDSTGETSEYITSIDVSGLHRTSGEIAKMNRLTERNAGAYLQYTAPRFTGGIAAIDQSYSSPLLRDTLPYNIYAFRGTRTTSVSGDYSYVWKNLNFFGETSWSSYSGAIANLHGFMAVIDPRVSVSVIYRNYPKSYYTFYNNGFSEGSNTQNERGIFAGTKVRLTNAWSVSTYADFYTFPWLKYLVDAPSRGNEFLVQPVFRPNRDLEIYGRYRRQLRQKNSRDSDGSVTPIENVIQENYRLALSYKVSESVTIKSRLEYVTIHRPSNTPEKGMVASQDLNFRPKSFPLDVSVRYAMFDTDSYDSRIYTFETNALYVFSVPAYYYQGSRAYVTLRYSFLRVCDVWLRYGTFLYSNRTSLGSGPEEIRGNRKSDITVQLRIAL